MIVLKCMIGLQASVQTDFTSTATRGHYCTFKCTTNVISLSYWSLYQLYQYTAVVSHTGLNQSRVSKDQMP